jgi:hypothetical protein
MRSIGEGLYLYSAVVVTIISRWSTSSYIVNSFIFVVINMIA